MAKKIKIVDAPVAPDMRRMLFTRWIMAKLKMDEAKKEQAEVRSELTEILEKQEPDLEGHRSVEFDEPIMGFVGIQYQRRVTTKPDMDVAVKLLADLGLSNRCLKMVPELDEEAVLDAVYDGEITEEQLSRMYPQKETFAVVVKRG